VGRPPDRLCRSSSGFALRLAWAAFPLHMPAIARPLAHPCNYCCGGFCSAKVHSTAVCAVSRDKDDLLRLADTKQPRQSANSTGESCSAICFGVCGKVTFCAGGGEGVYCRTRPSQRQTRREIAHNTKQITTQRGMGRVFCAYLRRRQRPVSVLHRVATGNFRFRNRRK